MPENWNCPLDRDATQKPPWSLPDHSPSPSCQSSQSSLNICQVPWPTPPWERSWLPLVTWSRTRITVKSNRSSFMNDRSSERDRRLLNWQKKKKVRGLYSVQSRLVFMALKSMVESWSVNQKGNSHLRSDMQASNQPQLLRRLGEREGKLTKRNKTGEPRRRKCFY